MVGTCAFTAGCGDNAIVLAELAIALLVVANLAVKPVSTISRCLTGHPVQDTVPA